MRIVVCIKQVPDTTEVKLDPKTNTLIREGVPSIINPDDKAGLEAALRLREQVGGTVTVLCMGPPQADVALREALAMGCDEAVLLSAREFGGSDTWATASIIAAGLNKIGYDLVITGRQAIDGDTAQVGPQIAEQLKVPQISYAEELYNEGEYMIIKQNFDDRYNTIKAKMPCLITILGEFAIPRYMTVGGIVDAYEKEITVLGFEDLKDLLNPEFIGLKGSPTNVIKSFTKQAKGQGTKLADLSADEAVAAIIQKLDEIHII
ncbi:MAG: electron transfer flavoprotein subunit beta/FixA family protein [Tissierellia bacterium]|nr:electron transfer flavoprotein subunit beta/FixA family protein [Tissierellia bacterium]MDD4725219.1 electron transfer flavoprotein subunit beta/FixA family protein [Tissierellia bacterium]